MKRLKKIECSLSVKWGKNTSLGQHLMYSYQYKAACSLAAYDYVQQKHLLIINTETPSHITEKGSTLRTTLLEIQINK